MTIDRREFLRRIAAGSAFVTMPAWLQGCGTQTADLLAPNPPDNPFLDWFGIDDAQVGTLMSTLTAGGAEIADIYFQHARTSRLTQYDGVLGNPRVDTRLGAGMRIVKGDEIGFASTEDLSAEALLETARQAGRGTGEPAPHPPLELQRAGDRYLVDTPWPDVNAEAKVAIIEKVDALSLIHI